MGCTPCGPPGLPGGGITAAVPVGGGFFSIDGSTSFGWITPFDAPNLSLRVPGCLANVLFGEAGLGAALRELGSLDADCAEAIASGAMQPATTNAANSLILFVIFVSSRFRPAIDAPFASRTPRTDARFRLRARASESRNLRTGRRVTTALGGQSQKEFGAMKWLPKSKSTIPDGA